MSAEERNPAIATIGLGRRYGGNWAVRHLEMNVPRGAVYGFLGLNGAGKTTTIRLLLGLLSKDEGSVSVLGFDPWRQGAKMRESVGFVPDNPTFYEWMTVPQLEAFVAHHRKGRWDFDHATRLRQVLELPPGQPVGTFSKGQRAKTALLLALAFRPELLVLDEPAGGLDPIMRRQLVESLLSEYVGEGNTVLISSHLINEISGLVDHVGLLKNGEMLYSGPAQELSDRIQRFRMSFEGEPPAIDLPGVLSSRRNGREIELVVDTRKTPDPVKSIAYSQAPAVAAERLNLEDIFVATMTAKESLA